MNDEALAKVMAELEREIGPERLSALRRKAANDRTSVIKLLGDVVSQYAEKLANPHPTHHAA